MPIGSGAWYDFSQRAHQYSRLVCCWIDKGGATTMSTPETSFTVCTDGRDVTRAVLARRPDLAVLDLSRGQRLGMVEAVWGEHKSASQILAILQRLHDAGADGDDGLATTRGLVTDGYYGGLVQDHALAAHVDQRVRRAQVDGEVVIEVAAQKTEHNCFRRKGKMALNWRCIIPH